MRSLSCLGVSAIGIVSPFVRPRFEWVTLISLDNYGINTQNLAEV